MISRQGRAGAVGDGAAVEGSTADARAVANVRSIIGGGPVKGRERKKAATFAWPPLLENRRTRITPSGEDQAARRLAAASLPRSLTTSKSSFCPCRRSAL